MGFDELIELMKKKGFVETFQVLKSSKNSKLEIHEFYKELLKFSYYNAFFRIKDKMIESGLLEVDKSNGKKYYVLTPKGNTIYDKLQEISELI